MGYLSYHLGILSLLLGSYKVFQGSFLNISVTSIAISYFATLSFKFIKNK